MKRIILLLTVFAGLGAYVYFYEIKGGEEREAAAKRDESLLRLEQAEITAFTVERPGSEPIRLSRSGDQWRVASPVDASVDRFVVDALARDAASAPRLHALEEVAEKLGEYGLDDPKLQLTIEAGGRQQVVRFGRQDYTGNNVYVQLEGDEKVYVTSKVLLSSANKDLKEWRSKSVLDFDQDQIQVVELQRPQGTLRVERIDGQWQLTQPIRDPADDSVVSSLLSAVRYARIEDFVEEEVSPEGGARYGLDRPQFELRLKPADRDEWQTLRVGSKTKEQYYARDSRRRTVFTIRSSVTENFQKPLEYFRDKKIVKASQAELDRFVLTWGEKLIEIRRDGDRFTITQPESQKGAETQAYKFWYPVTDIKFEQLDDGKSGSEDPRFARPDIRLELTLRDGSTRNFEFVQQGTSHRARKLEDGRSGTISSTDFEKLKMEAPSLVTPAG